MVSGRVEATCPFSGTVFTRKNQGGFKGFLSSGLRAGSVFPSHVKPCSATTWTKKQGERHTLTKKPARSPRCRRLATGFVPTRPSAIRTQKWNRFIRLRGNKNLLVSPSNLILITFSSSLLLNHFWLTSLVGIKFE